MYISKKVYNYGHVFSLKSFDKNAVLPVFCDKVLGKTNKSVCFTDELDCILSVQYSMRNYAKLIMYLDDERKQSVASEKKAVVQMSIRVAGKEDDEPDWLEKSYIFFDFRDGLACMERVLTESDMLAQKKKHFNVSNDTVQLIAYNKNFIVNHIDAAMV